MQKWRPKVWGCHGVHLTSRISWFPTLAILFQGIGSWYSAALGAEETVWSLTQVPTCADTGVSQLVWVILICGTLGKYYINI